MPGSFKWAQTSDDIEVTVALPEGTAKRDVSISLTAKRISVQLKGADAPVPWPQKISGLPTFAVCHNFLHLTAPLIVDRTLESRM